MDTKLSKIREQRLKGHITATGYVLACCKALELADPMSIDRTWLSSQIGITYTACTKALHRLRNSGDIP